MAAPLPFVETSHSLCANGWFLQKGVQHISKLDEITPENSAVIAHIYEVIAKLAKDLDLKDGFRVVSNCGEQAGQSVFHIHFHLLAGRPLAWPAG